MTSVLRVMGMDQQVHFQTYHRALNRAAWSPLAASRIVLRLLVRAFAPYGPLIFGLDDTIERRWGARIAAHGIYRDPVRSSRRHFVKVSGLRWLCMMLLVPIPWAARVWALPFFTALCPSERYHERLGKRQKTLTDWARQMIRQVRRWLPERPIVIVADSAFAALNFLDATRQHATIITRVRLDAALYAAAPGRHPKQRRRPRKKGKRLLPLNKVTRRRPHRMDIVDSPILVWRAKPHAASGQRNGALVLLGHARDFPTLGLDSWSVGAV